MDDGSYGICSNCGQDIGFERLRANPGAERCIHCQTLFEKTHGRPEPRHPLNRVSNPKKGVRGISQ